MSSRDFPPIRMARPDVGEDELAAVAEVFASGWLGEGPRARRFEEELEALTGAPHAVAVNTGTSALHLALLASGVGPGDEVILPAFTFVADAMAVRMAGARPIFADVDPETFNLGPLEVEACLSDATRAVMPTDYAGLPADTEAIRSAIGERAVAIVRDAAHSFGSTVRGRVLGSWLDEDATCFSFDPVKTLTCGEGGAVLVNDPERANRLRLMKQLGRAPGGPQTAPGFRNHLSDINAAIGLAQLPRLPDRIRARRHQARLYDRLLEPVASLACPKRDWDAIAPFMYVVRVLDGHRDRLAGHLLERGIHADLRYPPCHGEPVFEHEGPPLPVSEALGRECLSLPLHPGLEDSEIERVVDEVESCFRTFRREGR